MHSRGSGMCGESSRTERGSAAYYFSDQEQDGKKHAPVSPIGVVIVKFAHAIARVLERVKIWAGRGATFGTGVTAPFVASLPAAGSGAPVLRRLRR